MDESLDVDRCERILVSSGGTVCSVVFKLLLLIAWS